MFDFGSNRPGTLGGMDIFQSCKEDGVWTKPSRWVRRSIQFMTIWPITHVGNQVNGWLVTTRAGEFGALEVWEVTLDGLPAKPFN